ncbi:hypothetical protein SH668x_002286 [Planctomicrobium sp. SH668]|uniref:hypothetical protein n=1 Tax=Planctomicrobium sp. SH668 TaxID=3448126 RepID=UPI003F5C70BC
MNRSILLGLLTFSALVASVVIVIQKKVPKDQLDAFFAEGKFPEALTIKRARVAHSIGEGAQSDGDVEFETAEPIEHTDVELQNAISSLVKLDHIPWDTNSLRSEFSNPTSRACQVIAPNLPANPSLLDAEKVDGKLVSQFFSAFTVGLTLDASARAKMNGIIKVPVESYLSKHQLIIQPELCRTREGEFIFTGNVRGAFVSKVSRNTTEDAHQMIRDAVKSFRILGVVPGAQDGVTGASLPRTLVMAFGYSRQRFDESSAFRTVDEEEFELIFLHLLPKQESQFKPSLAVFVTTDGRTNLQELDIRDSAIRSNDASVTASIMFRDFTLLGVYPANPVVTGLTNQSRSSVSVDDLRRKIDGSEAAEATVLGQLLDSMHSLPGFSQSIGTQGAETAFGKR